MDKINSSSFKATKNKIFYNQRLLNGYFVKKSMKELQDKQHSILEMRDKYVTDLLIKCC